MAHIEKKNLKKKRDHSKTASLSRVLFLISVFIYFRLCWIFVAAQVGFSLLAAGSGCSVVAVTSLVEKHGLSGTWASVVAAPRL